MMRYVIVVVVDIYPSDDLDSNWQGIRVSQGVRDRIYVIWMRYISSSFMIVARIRRIAAVAAEFQGLLLDDPPTNKPRKLGDLPQMLILFLFLAIVMFCHSWDFLGSKKSVIRWSPLFQG